MRALVMSDDEVLVSFVSALLREAGIEAHVLDQHASALRGAVGLAPNRIVVAPEDWARARRLLEAADLGPWLVSEGDA